MPSRQTTIFLLSLLPLFIQGAHGLEPSRVKEKRQTPSPSSDTTPFPSSPPIIVLNDITSILTSCTLASVTWHYAGPALSSLELFATNSGIPQDPAPSPATSSPTNTFTDGHVFAVPSGASQTGSTPVLIAADLNPQASTVSWNVNVPAGWYRIFARINSTFDLQTESFYVQTRSDTSCLQITNPSTTLAGFPHSSSSSPPQISPSQSPYAPSTTHNTSHNSHTGVISGITIGTLTLLAIAALLYWWRRRRNKPSRRVTSTSWRVIDPFPAEPSIRQPSLEQVQSAAILDIRRCQTRTRVSDDQRGHGNSKGAVPIFTEEVLDETLTEMSETQTPSGAHGTTSEFIPSTIVSTLPSYHTGHTGPHPPLYLTAPAASRGSCSEDHWANS